MANPHNSSNSVDSSRYPRVPEPFVQTGDDRGMPSERGASVRSESAEGGAYTYAGGANGRTQTFGRFPDETSARSFGAPRRQVRADDDVHYTTSPFEKPRSESDASSKAIDPADRRGLPSRASGSALLIASALVGVVAVVLTVLMQVYISVPLFLVAFVLFYGGRGALRDSAAKINEPLDRDPGRRRAPDLGD